MTDPSPLLRPLRATAVLFCALLLSGCAADDPLDPAFTADEGFSQRWQRTFRAESYWSAKALQWNAIHQEDRARFHASLDAYRRLMEQRRQAVRKAEAEAVVAKKKPEEIKELRLKAASAFREELKRVREENVQLRERLRKDMELLQQAEDRLARARG